ncbi:MAG: amylo-alpha-1,6-glucosidase [Acidobacteria bacterium]|nr:MAG: amylo-alpha-1,6-glucosidase [Acidobacteriota bacterium]
MSNISSFCVGQFRRCLLMRTAACLAALISFTISALPALCQQAKEAPAPMELSRTVRPWEFLPVTGTRAALFGNETGKMEAWVYPLKLFREFHLNFLTEGRVLPADTLARTLTVRPESATILYAGDTFTVRETFFVPVDAQGAVILLDVETEQPLEVEAVFHRDFQLMWPAALAASYLDWSSRQHAFYFGEEQGKFVAYVGSPTATDPRAEFQNNYSESQTSSFRLGATAKGKDTKMIVIAGSVEGSTAAAKTYQHLTADYAALLQESRKYYQDYLARTVRIDLPDTQIQQAYDWARVSMFQGLVTNPYLGTGLVAGYRTSGESQRPGFAWFFGRDSFWTSLALNAAGDFSTTRTALSFISKFQREDGKIPHEISQGANFVDWFKGYPYPYASADATPLYIIAMNDYVMESGDTAFAKEKWDRLWKAYEFMRSTYDEHGFPKNLGVGHGWVEGGPLLPVKTELYQTGLGIEALRALSNLAHITGKEDASKDLAKNFGQQRPLMNETFWLADKKRFAFALDKDNHAVDEPGVLATVPMWFGLLDEGKADSMITQLADLDQQTDWGMRIISGHSPKFSGGGYHFGSVWPLFTGWAAVGEYRYHRVLPAYENLRANALLTFDGSLGHVSEVLSGAYYQSLSTSSPHQIWSAAMVVSPLMRGMLGLQTDAGAGTLTLTPHVPADWTSFAVRSVPIGSAKVDLQYAKDPEGITLEVKALGEVTDNSPRAVEFAPAVSLRAKVLGAALNGRPVPFHVQANSVDQHVLVRIPVSGGANTLRIRLKDDFGVAYTSTLPAIGATSEGLRVVSETWTPARDRLTLAVSGRSGSQYRLSVWNAGQIASVAGAKLFKEPDGGAQLVVEFPKDLAEPVSHATISLQFVK